MTDRARDGLNNERGASADTAFKYPPPCKGCGPRRIPPRSNEGVFSNLPKPASVLRAGTDPAHPLLLRLTRAEATILATDLDAAQACGLLPPRDLVALAPLRRDLRALLLPAGERQQSATEWAARPRRGTTSSVTQAKNRPRRPLPSPHDPRDPGRHAP